MSSPPPPDGSSTQATPSPGGVHPLVIFAHSVGTQKRLGPTQVDDLRTIGHVRHLLDCITPMVLFIVLV